MMLGLSIGVPYIYRDIYRVCPNREAKNTKPQDEERLDKFYLLLHTPVGQEHKLREAGVKVVLE